MKKNSLMPIIRQRRVFLIKFMNTIGFMQTINELPLLQERFLNLKEKEKYCFIEFLIKNEYIKKCEINIEKLFDEIEKKQQSLTTLSGTININNFK